MAVPGQALGEQLLEHVVDRDHADGRGRGRRRPRPRARRGARTGRRPALAGRRLSRRAPDRAAAPDQRARRQDVPARRPAASRRNTVNNPSSAGGFSRRRRRTASRGSPARAVPMSVVISPPAVPMGTPAGAAAGSRRAANVREQRSRGRVRGDGGPLPRRRRHRRHDGPWRLAGSSVLTSARQTRPTTLIAAAARP